MPWHQGRRLRRLAGDVLAAGPVAVELLMMVRRMSVSWNRLLSVVSLLEHEGPGEGLEKLLTIFRQPC